MTEQRQFEEMVKVMPEKIKDPLDNSRYIIFGKSLRREIARIYYNAGYGKVEDYKKEIARLKDVVMFGKCINCKIFEEMEQKLKQRAIKEFCERLKLDFTPYIVRDFATNCEINPNLVIDDLLKEYGIGETK